jgi:hypothetical protein
MKRPSLLVLLLLSLPAAGFANDAAADIQKKVEAALKAGDLIARVTEASEFESLFGAPLKEETRPDGDGTATTLVYAGGISAGFKQQNKASANTLVFISIADRGVDLGRPVLRTPADLLKLDGFRGLENVSLAKLDLTGQKEVLSGMPFDSDTQWPAPEMLPKGFDPAKLLQDGKNPGLGLRALHARGIDGRDVAIAIIDQPLLLDHREYSSRIVYFNALDVDGVPPQMHGPSVASFAVGRDIGTAPKASLYYFAVPTWKGDNIYYVEALQAIIDINAKKPAAQRIRVVSISTGMFSQLKNYGLWQQALAKAQAAGILVITCDEGSDDSFINYGTLTRDPAKDPDLADSYMPGVWGGGRHALWVPVGNRTRASHRDRNAYAFDVAGGRSWAAPYLAGVAALGFQVNPALTPEEMKDLLVKSATQTQNGPIINPGGFIELAAKTVKK